MSQERSQLAELVRLGVQIRPYLWLILLGSVLAAGAVGIYCYGFYEPTYTSEAIAMVRPQAYVENSKPEKEPSQQNLNLLPKPLDVTDYVLLLKSDGILGALAEAYNTYYPETDLAKRLTVERLRRQLVARERLELKTAYAVSYYPTVIMQTQAASPEEAHRLADLWMQVARGRTHRITYSAKEETFSYVDTQYQREREELRGVETLVNRVKDEGGELIDGLKLERANLEKDYEVETLELLRALREEWDRKIADASAEYNLPLLQARIQALTHELELTQLALSEKQQELATAQTRLAELTKEQANHPDFIVVGKAITDEALWSLEAKEGKGGGSNKLNELTLKSQEINPVARELKWSVAETKVRVAAIPAEIAETEKRLGELKASIQELQADYFRKETALMGVEQAKETEVKTKETERKYGLEDVKRRTVFDVDKLTRERATIEAQLDRDQKTQEDMFTSLARSRLQANLAVANTIDEFQVISEPTYPEKITGSHFLFFALVSFIVTFGLLLVLAFVVVILREILNRLKEQPSAA
ncbi:MAG: hypothetical protein HY706_20665 [Candidatus Hydrogenedentes bacterium]|nr:hypothetical protein [Candidatus Hydrogenedentota bacterium]